MKSKFRSTVLPIISLGGTFGLLYLLIIQIEKYQSGDRSSKLLISILLEVIGLFIFPFFFGGKKKGPTKHKPLKKKEDKNLTEQIQYFGKDVRLDNLQYTPGLIKRCKHCKFENPARVEKCYNCGKSLDFFS